MRVGTASVVWGFDPLYTWTIPPDFNTMLTQMYESGYEGTEISYHFPTDIELLRADLASHHLQAASTFHEVALLDSSTLDQQLALVGPVADRLQALGCDTLILSDHTSEHRLAVAGSVAADGSDGLSDRQWQSLAGGLNRIGEALRNRGMRAVFHPHVGTYVETREEIDRLCALTDPALIGLCPDTGHLAYGGADPEAVFVDYAERIWYVHIKDVDAQILEQVRAERMNFVEAVKRQLFGALGEGMVNMDRIFAALRAAHYDGWVIFEQDAAAHPYEAAQASRTFLRERYGI